MIKVINNRIDGSLFHYAHFLCDCLFPEIINNIYNYDEVIREKTIHQTIGNFDRIYMDVMKNTNIELLSDKFNEVNINTITYKPKEYYINKIYFNKFRDYIFSRYNINHISYNSNYPEVLLIKRGDRIKLINDTYLSNINRNVTTGKERREIKDIDVIESYLELNCKDRFKSIYFENLSFEEQVLYFNNAKLIVCAHGAVMSNMFFCKEEAIILEVTCNKTWDFFDKMSNILNLKHIKCHNNNHNDIINCISEINKLYSIFQ